MKFQLGGLRISLDFTFFAMLGLFLYLDVSTDTWWMLSALTLHELGHLLAAHLAGIPMAELSFSCFGVRLSRGDGAVGDWRRELLVYLGGPGMNLCWAALLLGLGREVPGAIHLVMGCFQLLPVGVLDGGCILGTLLERFAPPAHAREIGVVVSALALAPLFWLGWRLFRGVHQNFTLLVCCCFLMLSVLAEGIL